MIAEGHIVLWSKSLSYEMQVLSLVKFVIEFIVSNPFIVCSDELSFIKKQLYRDSDEMKVKQKAGVIHYKAYQGR